ncbi:IS630 family transposase [Roseiflexus sp. RS-1]|jgi:hypothetical protein|uniref:IS630 family transposase n=1 Tax=Roseiflexus sp. (strain RS-1) TaxID=357808 RepID=UPI0000D827D4|nr:IS630 family transposase [Roseiflexus sp. RS-1]
MEKKLSAAVAAVQAAQPTATVEVWRQDEGRIGLKPMVRRVWVKRGSRPRAVNHHRYEWWYAYSFVHPVSGRNWRLILPTVRTDVMSLALREFAQAHGVGAEKQVVLVLDGAGWHTSGKLDVPEGLHLFLLPAHTPELQPAERLWPLLHESVVNRPFDDLATLQTVLVARCAHLTTQQTTVKGLTNYHWWPQQ